MTTIDPDIRQQPVQSHPDSRGWQWLAITVVTGVLIWLLAPVLLPFAISLFFGYLGDPVADRLEAAGLSRTWSVCVVFLVMTAVAALGLFLLLPLVGSQIGKFVQQLPIYDEWLRHTALPWIKVHTRLDLAPYFDPQQIIAMLRKHFGESGVASQMLGRVSHSGMVLIQVVSTICLVPVLSFYFLRDWDVLVERIDALIPRALEPTIARLARESDDMLGGFLRGQLSVMVCLGTYYSIALWFVGLDLALLIGMITGLLSFVPYLGVITGVTLSLIAALVQFGDLPHVLMVAGAFAIGQTLEGFVLVPRLVGNKIGMHPVGVIFALMAGGQLFGFLGVLLALPMSAIAMVLLRYGHQRYTASRLYAGAAAPAGEAVPLIVVPGRVARVAEADAPPQDAT